MNRTALALATVLATAGFAAQAESPDPAGQFAATVTTTSAAAAPRAKGTHVAAPGNSANPWSTRFNPLDGFRSQRTRAEVQAEYIGERDRVHAFTGEDSGSAYLASRQKAGVPTNLAGQPQRAQ
jgi:hypothetical protein